jgi:hypothetical protein
MDNVMLSVEGKSYGFHTMKKTLDDGAEDAF